MKPLPPLGPDLQAKVDQFHAGVTNLLDRYIAGFETDMNRHAVKHGPMSEDRAIFDIAQLLASQAELARATNNADGIPPNMLAGMLAAAIVRGIAKKRKGQG